jgi:hypothetical protein
MRSIKVKIKRLELTKRVLVGSFIVACFWGLFGQQIGMQGLPATRTIQSSDIYHPSTAICSIPDLSFGSLLLVNIEREANDCDDDNLCTNKTSFVQIAIYVAPLKGVSLFQLKKAIKLYVLFNSWKSFLLL